MGKPEDYYKHMSDALNKTGRNICFAMCEWGVDDPWTWGYDLAQSWRATGDHVGTWSSTKQIIAESAAIPKEYTGKQYGWYVFVVFYHSLKYINNNNNTHTTGTIWTCSRREIMSSLPTYVNIFFFCER